MRTIALVAFLIVCATGCIGSHTTAPNPLPLERLTPPYRGVGGGLVQRARLVIRDPDRLAEVWTRAYGSETPVPDVDFARDMVIAVAMGEQATGGYSIEVHSVSESSGRVRVSVVNRLPGCGVVAMMMTQPTDFVRTPARDGPVEFLDRVIVRDLVD